MDGIKPPTPPKDLEVFFCPFFRKAISEANNLWYNILEVIQTGKYHRERAEYKSHISNPAYISKTNLILFYGRCKVVHYAYFCRSGRGSLHHF
ncbi:hypothetical protein [Agathobacter rectalis]|jgi:hypothetical protein|uniref:hypothetical protein n=1 Tax=Agathobacter rectalis TaxID=39491 RepID=UPI000E981A02|nr:hypothetical protein [Agathobacter rectalis]MCB7110462.1 hypothetical protein [Agathobacter rectalis]MCG4813763.1 hypothetical protein [Agathobacter rectalis]HAR01356.1 hypothetical protein [Eubacterium sp.]HBM95898.1 hypothetical protein [Eubacterium sp.]